MRHVYLTSLYAIMQRISQIQQYNKVVVIMQLHFFPIYFEHYLWSKCYILYHYKKNNIWNRNAAKKVLIYGPDKRWTAAINTMKLVFEMAIWITSYCIVYYIFCFCNQEMKSKWLWMKIISQMNFFNVAGSR